MFYRHVEENTFEFDFDEYFVLTGYYGTDILNVCGTDVRLIASVLTVFEDRRFRFHFDDTVGALVARQEVPFRH